MLMTVLKGEKAINQSKMLIRIFKSMKDYLIDNKILKQEYINNMVFKHENKIEYIDSSIKLLQESFDKLEENKKVNEIYFNGKIYDAYSKIIDIFKETKKELIVVDRYTDKTFLDMIKDLKSNVILITSIKSNITKLDLDKYNKTYNNLKIYYNELFHDRYIIIDKETIYHSGNSINHIGYRKSSIDIINDINVKRQIIKDINNIIN